MIASESESRFTPKPEYKPGMRKETDRRFCDHFKELGYSRISPFPIVPGELDKSVLFTGSVTTPFKGFIAGTMPQEGAFVVQPCFRAHNVGSFYNSEMPEFCSAFTGLGALAKPNCYEKICGDTVDFLTNILNVESGNILVRLSEDDDDINAYWRDGRINKEFDTRSKEFYRWTYGMNDIRGRGLTLAIRKDPTGDYQDVGNIIKINSPSGKELAVEMGFGTETLLSKIYGLLHPISAFPIRDIMPEVDRDSKMVKIGDAVMAIAALYNAGITPGTGNLDRILRRYIKGLDFILENNGLSWDGIFLNILDFYKIEYPDNHVSDVGGSLRKYVDSYHEFKRSFLLYVKEILRNKQIKRDNLKGMVLKAAESKGIPNPHANLLLENSFDRNTLDLITGVV